MDLSREFKFEAEDKGEKAERERNKAVELLARQLFADIDKELKGYITTEQVLAASFENEIVSRDEIKKLVEAADLSEKRMLSESEFVWFYKAYEMMKQRSKAGKLSTDQEVVLITTSLQNDFFHRFPSKRDTMNRYWVGRKDSERVLGFNPRRGPFAQLMNWVRGRADVDPEPDKPEDHEFEDGMQADEEGEMQGDGEGEGEAHYINIGERPPVHVIHMRTWVDKSDPKAKIAMEKYGEVGDLFL